LAGVITVILILIFSILITRVAAIALTHTGLSRESSKFQARSAFTGVGFTTSESEKVVNHPVRRRILLLLMILGNAGIVTGIASLIIGFTGIEERVDAWIKIVILLGGTMVLWVLANSNWIDQQLSRMVERYLRKHSGLNVTDFASLLNLSGDYRIAEMAIECEHWLCNSKLRNTRLRDEGVNVLAISRSDGSFFGAPGGETTIQDGDTLVVYGRTDALQKLEKRLKGAKGNKEHKSMIRKQEKVQKKELKESEKK
jgi:hypothetical protein